MAQASSKADEKPQCPETCQKWHGHEGPYHAKYVLPLAKGEGYATFELHVWPSSEDKRNTDKALYTVYLVSDGFIKVADFYRASMSMYPNVWYISCKKDGPLGITSILYPEPYSTKVFSPDLDLSESYMDRLLHMEEATKNYTPEETFTMIAYKCVERLNAKIADLITFLENKEETDEPTH